MKTKGDKISISLGLILAAIAFTTNSDVLGAIGAGLFAGCFIRTILD